LPATRDHECGGDAELTTSGFPMSARRRHVVPN
jgi:hypothetical protein